MTYAAIDGLVGTQQIALFGLPDMVNRQQPGMLITATDPWWGTGEFMYVRAGGTIRPFGLVVLTPTLSSAGWVWTVAEVPNTANLGQSLAVAMTSATVGQWLWVCVTGMVPVNCQASVAAGTTFGIAAVGQGGANSAGKQILNSRIIGAATVTVVKPNCTANAASNQLMVTNSDGWFIGAYLSGVGIAAGTTVVDITPDGRIVTLSVNTTAFVNGSVTATYNNGVIFYNVAYVNRPFGQGTII